MGWFSSDIDTFDELFVHTLQDIYYAEHQIAKPLPDMVEKASDAELEEGLPHAPQADQGPDQAARPRLQDDQVDAAGHQVPGHRRHHRRGERDRRRDRRQDRAQRRADRGGAGGRALRDHPLRHAGGLGEAARPQRRRQDCSTRLSRKRRRPTRSSARIAKRKINRKAAARKLRSRTAPSARRTHPDAAAGIPAI